MPDTEQVETVEEAPPLSFADSAAKAQADLAPEETPEPVETAPVPDPVEEVPDDDALLSKAEEVELREAAKNDPDKLVDGFKKSFYRKTQTLAEERKTVQQLADFQKALEANPETALTALAQQFGFSVSKPQSEIAEPEAFNAEQVVAHELGDDLAFLAPQLTRAVTRLADHIAGQKVQTIQTQATHTAEQVHRAEITRVMNDFSEKHPNWKQHEPAMEALGKKLQPHGMGEMEWMETLYRLVAPQTPTTVTASVVEKIVKAAAASDETSGTPMTESRVKSQPAGKASFKSAFEAAKRGEVWED